MSLFLISELVELTIFITVITVACALPMHLEILTLAELECPRITAQFAWK